MVGFFIYNLRKLTDKVKAKQWLSAKEAKLNGCIRWGDIECEIDALPSDVKCHIGWKFSARIAIPTFEIAPVRDVKSEFHWSLKVQDKILGLGGGAFSRQFVANVTCC